MLEERDGSGNVLARYDYGDDLIRMDRGSSTRYYLFDGLGSTRQLTDGTGAVTDTYAYDAFGNLTAQTGSTVNPYLFNGQEQDAGTGLYYLRARYMSPADGRFLSQDPYEGDKSYPISLHRYLYASGNPVNRVDFSGKDDFSEGGQLAATGIATEENATVTPVIGYSLNYVILANNLINARSTIIIAAFAAGIFFSAAKSTAVGTKPKGIQILFHYTDAAGAAGIARDSAMIATPQFNPSLVAGAYATEITPVDPGWTQRDISRLFYGGDPNRPASWFVELDNSDPYLGGFRDLGYQGYPHQWVKDYPAGLKCPVSVLSVGPNPMPLGT